MSIVLISTAKYCKFPDEDTKMSREPGKGYDRERFELQRIHCAGQDTSSLKKIECWKTCLRSNIVECFPLFHEFITSNTLSVDAQITAEVILHLTNLPGELKRYFPEIGNAESWIRNPFKVSPESINASLSIKQQKSLLEMSADQILLADFTKMSLIEFWAARLGEYPELSRKAVNFLLPFATTYLCESGFTHLVMIKTKYRNRLHAEPELRLKLTKIVPKIDSICDSKQPTHRIN
ncbi:hypothetical protein ILUMI_23969 [Ignelater luminosus]|uniref:HAT C-terminal dimerisation domain-containing protein n=1 Tax=Ignelater luminosus TaxID=2038154 RepID=A0A8K0CDJ6_IGNLU|nr:hypothetical protein ILUMI_23969 [Ignelater luminosus]